VKRDSSNDKKRSGFGLFWLDFFGFWGSRSRAAGGGGGVSVLKWLKDDRNGQE
jgi:hypothetical protein